ncbi:MAG: 3-hydroxyisobutyrate dehydrogenase-like beta-hydroxyacid dehydrogenase [Parasphingorhabdus sp.]|jgi:3-hydroxyisobutyrate dehydrogenase-like beta-hydroxyacid dehydrogenase
MGSALGRAMLENKFELTIWNRSPEKTDALTIQGAKAVNSFEAAIADSPQVMICITEYETARALLDQPSITSLSANKTIIQMSTGTPVEVRKMAQWVNDQGANYIDGSIMVYPVTIGRESARILVSGDEIIFND